MPPRLTEVQTETAYDALQDEMPLLARIQAAPGTIEQLAASVGASDRTELQKRLDRLVRVGLLRRVDDRYEAVGQLLYALRQDAMVSSLTHFVLPALTEMVARGEGIVVQMDLALDPAAQVLLRKDLVQRLLEEMDGLSVEPAAEKEPYTCIVIATSDVPPLGDPGSRLIETVRRAARQRSTPSAASNAILLQYTSFFGREQAKRAEALLSNAGRSLEPQRVAEGEKARYTFVLGFCRDTQKLGEAR